MIGWSELIFGSMYCGKSEELIRRLKRAKFAGQKYQLFKPERDDRYGKTRVATHENNDAKSKVEKILEIHVNSDIKKTIMNEVMTQMAGAMTAEVVNNSKEILDKVDSDTTVIGIDEVQFFDMELVQVVDELTKQGKRVIMAGLDMYATGEPWGVVPYLASKAKYVDKLHAVCVDCGKDAYISFNTDNSGANTTSQVVVGSVGKYVALCQDCANKRNKGE